MINWESDEVKIISKYYLILTTIEQKNISNERLTLRDHFIQRISHFLLPSYVTYTGDDAKRLSPDEMILCIICNSVCYKNNDDPTTCLTCDYSQRAQNGSFVICHVCVNVCTNIDTLIFRKRYLWEKYWHLSHPHISHKFNKDEYYDNLGRGDIVTTIGNLSYRELFSSIISLDLSNTIIDNHLSISNMIDKIVDNHLKIIDKYYNFDHKCASLLIMGCYDQNSILNTINVDIMIYILRFIYRRM